MTRRAHASQVAELLQRLGTTFSYMNSRKVMMNCATGLAVRIARSGIPCRSTGMKSTG